MMLSIKTGLVTLALGLAALGMAPAEAADLHGGSIKDSYIPMAPAASPTCYFRAATGYSWSRDPGVRWEGSEFANIAMGDSWLGEVALGCGSGGRGFRGEVAFTGRGRKSFQADVTTIPDDPAHTSVQNSTLMFNAYYDIADIRGFVPYVGAGVGFSYNRMSAVYFTNSPLVNQVIGSDQLTAAWALMAGVEYKFSSRASVDLGYRYIDLGLARSEHGDTGFNWNPHFKLDDLAAHELTVGVRYKFCGPRC